MDKKDSKADSVSAITSSGLFKEIGVRGEGYASSYRNEEKRIDALTIQDYRRMRDNDGQIQMLINAVNNTILSSGIVVNDDDEYTESQKSKSDSTKQKDKDYKNIDNVDKTPTKTFQDSREKGFIDEVLFTPKEKGGMSIDFITTCLTMLRAWQEGCFVFELVLKKRDDGMIVIDKLAPRTGKTESEFHLTIDDHGNWTGFQQRLYFKQKSYDVVVENTGEIPKVIKATFGEEYGSPYGRSALKAAWYHFDKAHKGMYLNHVAHERGAVKVRNIKHNLTSEDAVMQIVDAAAKLGGEDTVFAMRLDQGELFFEDATDANAMREGHEMINFHYSAMAKSVLAQFIDLGSNVSDTGSRAVSEDHSKFFKQGLQHVAHKLIEQPWNEVICALIKINFGSDIYPVLKVNPIADESSSFILNALLEMVKKGDMTDDVRKELLLKGSEKVGLDVSEETMTEALDDEAAKEQAQTDQDIAMQKMQIEAKTKMVKASEVNLNDSYVDETTIRPLYLDEQKVKLVDIKRKLDDSELRARVILAEKLGKQRDAIVEEYLLASRQGLKSIGKVKINLEEDTYSQELLLLATELMEYGKIGAAGELGISVPTTSTKYRKALESDVSLAIQDQQTRLQLRLAGVANNALEAGLPENDTRLLLENEYNAFFESVLLGTIALLLPKSLNRGRAVSFEKGQSQIFAYRYTAVLDSRTTDYCRALDGRVFQVNDPNYAMLYPPNHFGCRSVMTPILKTESNGVTVDGKPFDLPLYSSPSSFKDVDMSEPDPMARINTLLHRLEHGHKHTGETD